MVWTRPQREEIDGVSETYTTTRPSFANPGSWQAIEALGNKGWNWARFFEASKKSEK